MQFTRRTVNLDTLQYVTGMEYLLCIIQHYNASTIHQGVCLAYARKDCWLVTTVGVTVVYNKLLFVTNIHYCMITNCPFVAVLRAGNYIWTPLSTVLYTISS